MPALRGWKDKPRAVIERARTLKDRKRRTLDGEEGTLRELTKTGSNPVALRWRLVEAKILLVQIVDRGVLDMDIPSALA